MKTMIGIVTPYKTLNYGTKLQAYAMQEIVKEYGKCEIVNFNTSKDFRVSALMGKLSYSNIKSKFANKIQNKNNVDNKEYLSIINNRNKEIAKFDTNYHFSKRLNSNKELKEHSEQYETVICGSDQLWSPANVKNDWFTLNIFSSKIKKVSYAASFGVSNIPYNLKNKYKKFLSKFNHIAVREMDGAKIVKDIMGNDVTITLDPTLMLNQNQWEELAKKSNVKIEKPYVFCYFLGTNKKHREFAYNLAKKHNLELVNLPYIKCDNEADRAYEATNLDKVGPEDFVSLIANAKYVCTDSFHGTAFSVIFNKQFAVFERFENNDIHSTNSRIYSILELLNIKHQLITSKTNIDDFDKKKIEYNDVNKRLEREKQKSFQYLNEVLAEKR